MKPFCNRDEIVKSTWVQCYEECDHAFRMGTQNCLLTIHHSFCNSFGKIFIRIVQGLAVLTVCFPPPEFDSDSGTTLSWLTACSWIFSSVRSGDNISPNGCWEVSLQTAHRMAWGMLASWYAENWHSTWNSVFLRVSKLCQIFRNFFAKALSKLLHSAAPTLG